MKNKSRVFFIAKAVGIGVVLLILIILIPTLWSLLNPTSFYTRRLESQGSFQRFSAICMLIEEQAYSPEVIQAVSQRFSDDDLQVQDKALEFLVLAARLGTAEFDQIKQLQDSENQQIRDYAAKAIVLTKYDFAVDREAAEKAIALGATITVFQFRSISKMDWRSDLDDRLFQLIGAQLLDLPLLSKDDLAALSKLPMLSELALGGTEVTDDGLRQLQHFPALKKLSVTRSHLNDDDMQILAGIPELAYLNVSDTEVTYSGINKFLQTKSNCEVDWIDPVSAPQNQ